MQVSKKALRGAYARTHDAIARLDIDQEVREQVAEAVTEALDGSDLPEFNAEVFQLLASDPLILCAGTDEGPCPHEREIRIGMHLSTAVDGRSAAWRRRIPEIRCVSCGAAKYLPVAS